MYRRKIALYLSLRELDRHNIPFQLSVYLLMCKGLRLNYHFMWYSKKILSKELNYDIYGYHETYNFDGWALNDDQKQIISDVRDILDCYTIECLNRIAEVLFVMNTNQGQSPIEIFTLFKNAGKSYSLNDIERTIRIINDEFRQS